MRLYVLIFGLLSCLALPSNGHAQIAMQVRPQGSYLGLRLNDLDADRARALKMSEVKGVEVAGVIPGSPAEIAGIRSGDVLLSYNGENIVGGQQFIRLVGETPPGRKIKIQLWREGKSETLTIVTGVPADQFRAPGWFDVRPEDPLSLPTVMISDIPTPMLLWRNRTFGIECEPVESQLAQYFGVKRGVLVRSVESGSAAEKAGLRAGDVVTAIGDRPVANPHDMTSFMRESHPGNSVTISLVRDHRTLNVTIAVP